MIARCLLLFTLVVSLSTASEVARAEEAYRKELPEVVVGGYAPECAAGGSNKAVLASVEKGVNLVLWFSMFLISVDGNPTIKIPFDMGCVAKTIEESYRYNPNVLHFISVGGWNAPHPDLTWSGREWNNIFNEWEREQFTEAGKPDMRFDGIDWDIEGNDDPSSEFNHVKPETLELVLDMSRHAKEEGRLIKMVPAESYLDPYVHRYDNSLLHAYPWWHPEFKYHGRNTYAPLLWHHVHLFDFIDVQLYETFSRAHYMIDYEGYDVQRVLDDLCNRYADGWKIFHHGHVHHTHVPLSKLMFGFSTGITPGRMLFVEPADIVKAFKHNTDCTPRGLMYWNIELDEKPVNGTDEIVHFARDFGSLTRDY
eukprot:Clim_evm67s152 gene=Clim_evmTU67s152